MHAPMSFFETTVSSLLNELRRLSNPISSQPLGRIMNRFAKDIDTIDNVLSDEMRMFENTFSQMIGAIVLISVSTHSTLDVQPCSHELQIVVPWFLIAMSVVIVIYYYMALFYRSSARELKVSSVLGSLSYSYRSSAETRFYPAIIGLFAFL